MSIILVYVGGILLVLLLLIAVVSAACAYWASGSVLRRAGKGCLCGLVIVLLPVALIVVPLLFIR
ncbi:hypothetical protein ABT095_22495 [Kitasatospora sp. NPDC002227]|uniref:hypothetical protein n=1 Tax=Kitasatospora sp. NPDC002227 TaxID=3154773 RepID=UPI00332994EB